MSATARRVSGPWTRSASLTVPSTAALSIDLTISAAVVSAFFRLVDCDRPQNPASPVRAARASGHLAAVGVAVACGGVGRLQGRQGIGQGVCVGEWGLADGGDLGQGGGGRGLWILVSQTQKC